MKMKGWHMKCKMVWVMAGLSLTATSIQAKELARVNESVITDRDLEMALSSLNEGQRSSILKDANSRRQILLDVIDREVLAQEAEKLKLDQSSEYQDRFKLLKKQLLMSLLLEKKFASQLTKSEVKKYYELHKGRFSTDQVHVQQILVSDEAQANKILETVKNGSGDDFLNAAEKYSKDPSAKNNRGDLGFIGRDRFVPEFTEAAFSTPVGQITGPVKTIYGYHLIRVVEKRMGKPLELDEVELQVRNALRQELVRNYVDNLKAQSKIKVDNVAVEKY